MEPLIESLDGTSANLKCVFSGDTTSMTCDALVPVTRRIPVTALYEDLLAIQADTDIKSVRRIGDAEAPSIIAAAVHGGYRAAVELGQNIDLADKYGKREQPPVGI